VECQGDRQGSQRHCPLSAPEKIIYRRRGVNSVDNAVSQALWCDHVAAKGMFLGSERLSILLSPRQMTAVHIVVEEGKVKMMCTSCYMKAVQIPLTVI
jgi:hypothetical protein